MNWTKAYIEDHTTSFMLDFIDWLSLSKESGFLFFNLHAYIGLFFFIYFVCIVLCLPLGAFNICSLLPIKKKNKKKSFFMSVDDFGIMIQAI